MSAKRSVYLEKLKTEGNLSAWVQPLLPNYLVRNWSLSLPALLPGQHFPWTARLKTGRETFTPPGWRSSKRETEKTTIHLLGGQPEAVYPVSATCRLGCDSPP